MSLFTENVSQFFKNYGKYLTKPIGKTDIFLAATLAAVNANHPLQAIGMGLGFMAIVPGAEVLLRPKRHGLKPYKHNRVPA